MSITTGFYRGLFPCSQKIDLFSTTLPARNCLYANLIFFWRRKTGRANVTPEIQGQAYISACSTSSHAAAFKSGRSSTLQCRRPQEVDTKSSVVSRVFNGDHWTREYSSAKEVEISEELSSIIDVEASVSPDQEERLEKLAMRLQTTPPGISTRSFSLLMRTGKLKITTWRAQRLIQILAEGGNWRQAANVAACFSSKQQERPRNAKHVYTTLLSVLGKAHQGEAVLQTINTMMRSEHTWPDAAAYRAAAVGLGRAGLLQPLLKMMEELRQGHVSSSNEDDGGAGEEKVTGVGIGSGLRPRNRAGGSASGSNTQEASSREGVVESGAAQEAGKGMSKKQQKKFPPLLPDVHVYNAVLNACLAQQQWLGVPWVLDAMAANSIRPNSATYGLAIKIMSRCNRGPDAWALWERTEALGLPSTDSTFKSLVSVLATAGKISVAEAMVREMEVRGIQGKAGVYYSLACAQCAAGRWQDAIAQVHTISNLENAKPIATTYTGLIRACYMAGLWEDAIACFDKVGEYCAPNVGMYNLMIRIYGVNGLFKDSWNLYQGLMQGKHASHLLNFRGQEWRDRLEPDRYTFRAILATCVWSKSWGSLASVVTDMRLRGLSWQEDEQGRDWLREQLHLAGQEELAKDVFRLLSTSSLDDNLQSAEVVPNVAASEESSRDVSGLPENPVLKSLARTWGRRQGTPNSATWRFAIGCVGDLGLQLEQVREILVKMEECGCLLDLGICSDLVHVLLMGGGKEAVEFSLELVGILESNGMCADVALYSQVIRGCCKQRLWSEANNLACRALDSGFELSPVVVRDIEQAEHSSLDPGERKLARQGSEGLEASSSLGLDVDYKSDNTSDARSDQFSDSGPDVADIPLAEDIIQKWKRGENAPMPGETRGVKIDSWREGWKVS